MPIVTVPTVPDPGAGSATSTTVTDAVPASSNAVPASSDAVPASSEAPPTSALVSSAVEGNGHVHSKNGCTTIAEAKSGLTGSSYHANGDGSEDDDGELAPLVLDVPPIDLTKEEPEGDVVPSGDEDQKTSSTVAGNGEKKDTPVVSVNITGGKDGQSHPSDGFLESDKDRRARLVQSFSITCPGTRLSIMLREERDRYQSDSLSQSCYGQMSLEKGRPELGFGLDDDEEIDEEVEDEDAIDEEEFKMGVGKEQAMLILEDVDEELRSLDWLMKEDLMKGLSLDVSDTEESRKPVSIPATAPRQHPSHIPYHPLRHQNTKPPYSFSCLIFMAIEDSTGKRLPVKDIYSWILRHFPYYQNASSGWKNSVRHNLSLNKFFKRVDKDRGVNIGKGAYWCIEDNDSRLKLLQAVRRTPYHPYHQLQMTAVNSGHHVAGPNFRPIQQASGFSGGATHYRPLPAHLFPYASRELDKMMKEEEQEMDVNEASNILVMMKQSTHSPGHSSRSLGSFGARSRSPSPPEFGSFEDRRRKGQKYRGLSAYQPLGPIILTPIPSGDHNYIVTAQIAADAAAGIAIPDSVSSDEDEYESGFNGSLSLNSDHLSSTKHRGQLLTKSGLTIKVPLKSGKANKALPSEKNNNRKVEDISDEDDDMEDDELAESRGIGMAFVDSSDEDEDMDDDVALSLLKSSSGSERKSPRKKTGLAARLGTKAAQRAARLVATAKRNGKKRKRSPSTDERASKKGSSSSANQAKPLSFAASVKSAKGSYSVAAKKKSAVAGNVAASAVVPSPVASLTAAEVNLETDNPLEFLAAFAMAEEAAATGASVASVINASKKESRKKKEGEVSSGQSSRRESVSSRPGTPVSSVSSKVTEPKRAAKGKTSCQEIESKGKSASGKAKVVATSGKDKAAAKGKGVAKPDVGTTIDEVIAKGRVSSAVKKTDAASSSKKSAAPSSSAKGKVGVSTPSAKKKGKVGRPPKSTKPDEESAKDTPASSTSRSRSKDAQTPKVTVKVEPGTAETPTDDSSMGRRSARSNKGQHSGYKNMDR